MSQRSSSVAGTPAPPPPPFAPPRRLPGPVVAGVVYHHHQPARPAWPTPLSGAGSGAPSTRRQVAEPRNCHPRTQPGRSEGDVDECAGIARCMYGHWPDVCICRDRESFETPQHVIDVFYRKACRFIERHNTGDWLGGCRHEGGRTNASSRRRVMVSLYAPLL